MQIHVLVLTGKTLVFKHKTYMYIRHNQSPFPYSAPEQESQLLKIFIESFLSLKRV